MISKLYTIAQTIISVSYENINSLFYKYHDKNKYMTISPDIYYDLDDPFKESYTKPNESVKYSWFIPYKIYNIPQIMFTSYNITYKYQNDKHKADEEERKRLGKPGGCMSLVDFPDKYLHKYHVYHNYYLNVLQSSTYDIKKAANFCTHDLCTQHHCGHLLYKYGYFTIGTINGVSVYKMHVLCDMKRSKRLEFLQKTSNDMLNDKNYPYNYTSINNTISMKIKESDYIDFQDVLDNDNFYRRIK